MCFERKTCQKSTLAGLLIPVAVRMRKVSTSPARQRIRASHTSSRDSWKPCPPKARKQAALGHCVNLPVSHRTFLRGPKTGKGGAFLSWISLHSCSAERQPFLSLHGSSLPLMLLRLPPGLSAAFGLHHGALIKQKPVLTNCRKQQISISVWCLVPSPVSIHNTSCPMHLLGGMLRKAEWC